MSDESELEQLLKNFQKTLDTLNKIGDVDSLVTKVDAKKNRKLLKKVKTVVSDVHNKVSTLKEKFSNVYYKTKAQNNSETDGSSLSKSINNKEIEASNVNQGECLSSIIGPKNKHAKKPSAQSKDREKQTIGSLETSVERNEQNTDPTQCNGHSEEQDPVSTSKHKKSCRVVLDRMDIDDGDKHLLENNGETSVNSSTSSVKANEASDGNAKDANEVSDQTIEKNNEGSATPEKNDANSESSEEIIEGTPSKPSMLRLTLSQRKTQDQTNQDLSEVEIMDSASETEDNGELDKEKSGNNKGIKGQSKSLQSKKKNGTMQNDDSSEKKHEASDYTDKKKKQSTKNKVQDNKKNENSGKENGDSDGDETIVTDTNEENESKTSQQDTDEEGDNGHSDHTDTEGQTKAVNPKKNKRSEVEREESNEDNVEQSTNKKDHRKTNTKKSKQKSNREINENKKSVTEEENSGAKKNKSKDKEEKDTPNEDSAAPISNETVEKGQSEATKIQEKSDEKTEDSVSQDEAAQTKKTSEKETDIPNEAISGDNKEVKEEDTSEKPLVPRIKLVDINKLLAPNKKPLDMTPTPGENKKLMPSEEPVIVLTSSDDDIPTKKTKESGSVAKRSIRKSRVASKVDDLSDFDSNDENGKISKKSQKAKKKGRRLSSNHSPDDSDFGSATRTKRLRNRKKPVSSAFAELIKKRSTRKSSYSKQIYSDDSSDDEASKGIRKNKRVKRRSSTSDSDEEWGEKSRSKNNNTKKRKRKKLLEHISLSEDSDSSVKEEVTKSSSATINDTNPDKNDPKFSMKISIRLPKFMCEEMAELYKKKKEIFEVKESSKRGVTRRERPKNQGSSKHSDDSDRPECKKLKLSEKLTETEETKEGEDKSSEKRANGETDEAVVIVDETDASNVEEVAGTHSEQVDKEGEKDNAGKQSKKNESDDDDTMLRKVDEDNQETNKQQKNDGKEKKDGHTKSNNSEGEKEQLKEKKTVVINEISDSDGEKEKDTSKKQKNKRKAKKDDSSDTQEEDKPTKEKKKDKKAAASSDSDDSNEKQKSGDGKDATSSHEETDEPKKKKEKDKKAVTTISSDSDDDFANFSRKKDQVGEAKRKAKKKLISDSDSDWGRDKSGDSDSDSKEKDASQSDDKESEKSEAESEASKKPARGRIKRVKDSSSDDEDKSTRKQIRKMIDRESLSETTKKAEQEEKERKARIAEKQKKYNQIFELKADATVDKVVLDFDEKTDKPLLSVHKKLVKHLKPHQVHGVKFMWDTCFESLDRAKNTAGSGCILAHCMGLGKTLQVIALVHTLLTNQAKTKVERVLVVCPVSTVLNWKNEFKKWMPKTNEFEIYELVSCKTTSINHERSYVIKSWFEDGGVLIIGYNMFRTLSNPQNKTVSKKLRESFQKGLVDPGPDLVVCDEGHLLKNEKSNLSIAMNRIKTARRIVLTGTPLQNNLREYWCMVQFIKPNLLGTYKEYLNRFVNPITNGQYTDSTQHDIMVMRRRSHVLHKLLNGVVQRQDYSVLEPYLPPKYEFVIFVKLTELQVKLYKHYIEKLSKRGDNTNKTSVLFNDFQQLQRICTHPRVLLEKSIQDRQKEGLMDYSESEGSLKDFIDDDSSTSESSSSSGSEDGFISDDSGEVRVSKANKKNKTVPSRKTRMTRALAADNRKNGVPLDLEEEESEQHKEWWEEYISKDELDDINLSSKLFLLFQILKECEEIGDKILIFSQSLYTLDCIEYFLEKIDEATQSGEPEKVGGHSGTWSLGLDYFRLDGSSSCDDRANRCDQFNDPDNTRARLFLISTRAGGLGINLVAANRVIIFDVSWNPSHDIQSIYRVYRFGQTKPAYIYRFVTYGTMEMKIYERQVTKQAISKRVIDEQQIDRHYSQNDIMELYNTDLEPTDRPIPMVPKDVLLGELLQKHEQTIFKYHEHQSLLENKQDEELNEEERKAAWDEFENEKVMRKTSIINFGGTGPNSSAANFSPQLIQMALTNIVRKDNPTWSEIQIKGIIPALASQLQVQMSENDFSMYYRVQQEIKFMQALHAQRMRELYLKQYQAQLQQKLTHDMLGNMSITPEEIRRIQMAQASQNFIQAPTTSAVGSGDVIELND